MNQRSWTTLIITALFVILSFHHHMKASGVLLVGQAETRDLSSSYTNEVLSKDYSKIDTTFDQNLVVEAKREKFSLENTTASRLLVIEQETARKHRKFQEEVRTSDVTRLDLRKPSGLSAGQADLLLEGTGLEGLGKAFVDAEKKYEVNAYYLIAHAAWESAWGKSRISREKNNLFGYMAYDANPYHSAKKFKSKAESIDVVARFISQNYLHELGPYYNGATLQGMNVRYATDDNWDRGIAKVMLCLVNKLPTVDKAMV